MLPTLSSLLFPLPLSASLTSLSLGAVIASNDPTNGTMTPVMSAPIAHVSSSTIDQSLDATTPDGLLRILKGIAQPQLPIPPTGTTRPIYARIEAVNDLYVRDWGFPKDYKVCGDIKDADFTFPANCTTPETGPKDYRFHGIARTLQRRATPASRLPTCFSIPVRCIDVKTVPKTAKELDDRVQVLLESHEATNDGFGVTEVIMAPTAMVRELGKECAVLPENLRSSTDGASVAVWKSKDGKDVTVECF
ncbi:hypothetical protein BJ684DRAFT_15338 [Piptocephalis cylindrospora]|uniref:Uncharacterized protein n=1 Tax=Piptocephalis cylindrospora TaxID=1907219 RepID=A0A4P9Y5N1_9FUNG|nr:hypothetical protein BJ684DRAFT_15338 [Piptocephalis cylindrospora]|eukprot:RKP14326.1 hypothetical protein BJ684DRAFT_15338 [Piptocephalis cylindrospora]